VHFGRCHLFIGEKCRKGLREFGSFESRNLFAALGYRKWVARCPPRNSCSVAMGGVYGG
jgi:hypothetical protein